MAKYKYLNVLNFKMSKFTLVCKAYVKMIENYILLIKQI